MAMNKRGQTGMFFLLMIGIVMFIIGSALSSALIKSNQNARDNMDCQNLSISTYKKVTCTVVDVVTPFVVGLIFALGGVALTSRLEIG